MVFSSVPFVHSSEFRDVFGLKTICVIVLEIPILLLASVCCMNRVDKVS